MAIFEFFIHIRWLLSLTCHHFLLTINLSVNGNEINNQRGVTMLIREIQMKDNQGIKNIIQNSLESLGLAIPG